jgi:hypothetical protein
VSGYEELRLLLATCQDGETRKEICPFCGGGRSKEASLSITRFDEKSGAYQCKRASCGKEGYLGGNYGTHYKPVAKAKEWEPRIYDGTIEELPDDIADEYAVKYGWTREEVRDAALGWSPEYRRTAWEIRSPTGTRRGIELRTLNGHARAKTLHFRHSADTWVGYVESDRRSGSEAQGGRSGSTEDGARNQPLVAVEDLLSAYRVAQVYPAASIMGSHLTFETLTDLMKVSERIVLCLDRDATEKAEKFAQRFMFLCPGFTHIPLQRDLKYEQAEDIKKIVGI